MKKLGYMLLLSSLALVLSACGDDTSKSSLNQSSGLGSLDSGLSVDPNNSNSNPNESGSSGGKISSSEQPPIDYTIGWSQDVLDVMEPHLGGHAIPFIDLPGRVLATWIEASSSYSSSTVAHLSILSTGAFDAALAGQAKLTYQKAGWTVDFNRETLQMHAEETKLGMKVDFYGEYDQNDGSTTPQIDVYYNEPFAVPASGAWRSATVQALASIGVAAPHMLPYTYLGTLAEETVSISTTELDIQGKVGGWDTYNAKILAAARKAFAPSKKWAESTATVTFSSGYYSTYSYTGYSFTKNFADGYTVTAVLYGRSVSGSSYSSDPKTPYLRVILSQQ